MGLWVGRDVLIDMRCAYIRPHIWNVGGTGKKGEWIRRFSMFSFIYIIKVGVGEME